MTKPTEGNTVKVTYTGALKTGEVFDQVDESEPLVFQIGNNEVIVGFENAVKTMSAGEEIEVKITPDDAYGDYSDTFVVEVEKSKFPESVSVTEGNQIWIPIQDTKILAKIIEVTETSARIDANHPLAGQDLHYTIKLLEIS